MGSASERLIDLSHTVRDGLVTYEGLPATGICDFLSREDSREYYAPGTEFQIGKIEMVANTGTYVDSPFHRFADGKDLSELPLLSIADVDGIVVRVGGSRARAVDAPVFEGIDVRGRAVLVHADWSRHWDTESYFSGHPYLTEAAAVHLRDAGARIVGIDSYNIDDTANKSRPVHTVLLGSDIPIVEHMTNLGSLPDDGFRFSAVPVKVKAFGSFPVRAFACLIKEP